MESAASALAIAKAKSQQDYVSAFGQNIALFTHSPADEALSKLPSILVKDFAAERAELWLWDQAASAAYLAHWAGRPVTQRRQYAAPGPSALGRVLEAKAPLQNVDLSQATAEDKALHKSSGLSHLTCRPLMMRDQLVAVLAMYSDGPAGADQLSWWAVFAELAAGKMVQTLASQEKQRNITQLSLLFEATRLLNSTLDLAELLDTILKIARTEVQADRGSVFLVDHKRKELWSIVASGLESQEIRIPFGTGVAGRVAETGETINVEDAYTLPYFERSFDQKFGYHTQSLLCMPIRHTHGGIVGVIQILNKTTGTSFTPEDEDFLNKLSGHMALALENARLHRDSLEKQRLEKELALARDIQRSLLPESPPIVPGYELAVLNEPCYEVGGDYYDFLHLGAHTLLLVIADVEGKGVSSAMVMSNLQATLRALVMHLHSLEVLAMSLNEMIYNDTKSEKYLSIFLGLLDIRRGGLHYINAGHVPPLVVQGDSGDYKLLEDGGTVIGLFPQSDYSRGSVKLLPGDLLVLCTDGIYEACNVAEEEFGNDRLAAVVSTHRNLPAQTIVETVLQAVNDFSRGGPHIDDKVLMIMKVAQDGTVQTAKTGPRPN